MSLKAELYEMIAETCSVEIGVIVDESHLQEDLGADSLMIVELAEAIAAKYGITIDADDLMDLENVCSLPDLVASRGSTQGHA